MGITAAGATAIAAGVSAAGTAGSSIMSAAGGAGGSTNQTHTTGLGNAILPYLGANADSASVIAQNNQTGYGGQMYQGMSPTQTQIANQGTAVALNPAYQNLGNQGVTSLQNSLGYGAQAGANAQNLYNTGIAGPDNTLSSVLNNYATGASSIQGPSSALSSALNTGAVNSANALSGYNSTLSQASQQGLSDPTQQLANDAQTYMNSSAVQSALNSTNAQINQTLNEQTNPAFNRAAAAGGSLNSSRAGMGEAMNNENAAIATGNADAQIQNNAYNQGLSTAANTYTSGLNSAISGAAAGFNGNSSNALNTGQQQQNLGIANASNQLNAANTGLTQNLGYETNNANLQLNANSQLANMYNSSLSNLSQPVAYQSNLYNLGAQSSGSIQSDANAALNGQYQQYLNQTQLPMNLLNQSQGIINGGSSTGTTNTAYTNPTPAYGQVASGLVNAGLGIYNNYNSMSPATAAQYNATNAANQSLYGSSYNAITAEPTDF